MRGPLVIFFDGGCRPNPGPMTSAVVSRGRVLIDRYPGPGDNNEAEWLALLRAVDFAGDAPDVLFVGDSASIITQASGRQPCRSTHLRPYLARYQAAVVEIRRLRLRLVPRSRNLAGIALARHEGRQPATS